MEDGELRAAKQALERGEYTRVIRCLEPLLERYPASSTTGASIRLLMATALMGQGRSESAADYCRELRRCPDPTLRAQASDLLEVLEAPALQRPREWSLTMPDLTQGRTLEQFRGKGRRSRRPPPPPPPPVGDTKAPVGFALLSLGLVLTLLLAALLSGCMDVRSDLRFAGPGRLQLEHHLISDSGAATPWQRRFALALAAEGFASKDSAGQDWLTTPVLPAQQALDSLVASVRVGGQLSGRPLPAPQVRWKERNWVLGVSQNLGLEIDLRALADLGGVNVSLALEPLRPGAVRRSSPMAVVQHGRALVWPLRVGESNRLELRCWRWSPLGLGCLLIPLGLAISLGLQRIRQRLGFGFPELPA
ncbi:MAG: DUF3153 domain-containing protein [Synechococcaceae cyanobacterium]|nr:DUF3153 domain-containing protein [Synechococcaceae cyanobacterium]